MNNNIVCDENLITVFVQKIKNGPTVVVEVEWM